MNHLCLDLRGQCLTCGGIISCGTFVAWHRRMYVFRRLSLLHSVMVVVLVCMKDIRVRGYHEEIVVDQRWLLIIGYHLGTVRFL